MNVRNVMTGIAGAALASGLLLGSSVAPANAASSAAAAACTVTANAPFWRSPNIYATGYISCGSPQEWLNVEVYVWQDGVQQGWGTETNAYNATYVSDTAVTGNHVGDQQWCTEVFGHWPGGSARKWKCETTGA